MISFRPIYAAVIVFGLCAVGVVYASAVRRTAQGTSSTEEGKTLFEGNCAGCHGIDGSGGMGPSIRQAAATLGPDGIMAALTVGIMGSGMPTFDQLGKAKLTSIVEYVGSLGRDGTSVVAGNAEKGKEIYDANGCSSCHIIDGVGGNLGPDLTRIGALRALGPLYDAVVKPGENLPLDVELAERSQFTAHLMYRAVTKTGKEIGGMRVNEDSFTIQLRDASGRLYSLQKMELRKLEPLPGKSVMPSYKDKLSQTQISDLIGYLASLRGAQ